MLVQVKLVLEEKVQCKIKRLLNTPLPLNVVMGLARFVDRFNLFYHHCAPAINLQEEAYNREGRGEEFALIKEGFFNSVYDFDNIEPVTITGHNELYDPIFDDIIYFE